MKKISALLCMFLVFAGTQAQRSCGSTDVLHRHLHEDPSLQTRMDEIEEHTNKFVKENPKGQRVVVTIPVVVHVVYNTTAQNISQAQIQSQLDVLNADFRKLNADASLIPSAWQSIAADCEYNFCLAQRDPNGNATTGVERRQTTVTGFSTNDAMKYYAQGGLDAWNSSQYLNLWVCNMTGGILGYAQFPGGPAATDGVVILYSAFGTTGTAAAPFNKGRTATHEVGHWMNLYHIWGDDTNCTGTDNVADTPNQQAENYGCPTFPKTDACTSTSPGVMFMNYMDYVDDACMYMFTAGQKARMQALFATGGSRASLKTSLGCTPPTTSSCPTPTGVTVGSITNTGAVVSWAAVSGATSYQILVGSNTYTSTTTSYTLSSLTACTGYSVTVKAVCSTTSISNASTAASFTTTGCTTSCTDAYETNNSSSTAKTIAVNTNITAKIGTATDIDWFKFTNTTAAKHIKVTLTNLPYDYDVALYSPSGTLLATAQNSGTTAESIIYNNGVVGTYKVKVYGYNSAYSATSCYTLRASTSATTWVRTTEDFEDGGKPLFEDMTVFPNPTNGIATLSINATSDADLNIAVYDQMGRMLNQFNRTATKDANEIEMDFSDYANGVYFIQVVDDEIVTTKKIVVQK